MLNRAPTFIDTASQAVQYLTANGLRGTYMRPSELDEARQRLQFALAARFGAPKVQSLPDDLVELLPNAASKFNASYMWDRIPWEFTADFSGLWAALQSTPGQILVLFESREVPGFAIDGSELIGKTLSAADLYIFPATLPWVFVVTHEDAYGPYLVDLVDNLRAM